tara:strand:- start:2980 stop:3645 length:666 start_codon:yes stop_codon:yes gene_type:complete
MNKIAIIGPFRSCTNLMKAMIDKYTFSRGLYNKWFWKHGLPPTIPNKRKVIPSSIPIIVMSVDPYPWHSSMYQFWIRRRPELINEDETLQEFIRKKICIYDNSRIKKNPHYLFNTPSDYWNAYYYSWLNWADIAGQVVYVSCKDLLNNPSGVMASLGSRYNLKFKEHETTIQLPKERKGPLVIPLEDSKMKELNDSDIQFIKDKINDEIFCNLEKRFIKIN